jgi:competence protein CoiA
MRYAFVESQRQEAAPRLKGMCLGCAKPVIAKCGSIRIWHWAHTGHVTCSFEREKETKWHRKWKNCFTAEAQEVICHAPTGERHIADVKTLEGVVLEFQHSYLPLDERVARERFYQTMFWVVDGTRLKRDKSRFQGIPRKLLKTKRKGLYLTKHPEESFPANWLDCKVPVFFDFEGIASTETDSVADGKSLWGLLPGRVEGRAAVVKTTRLKFVRNADLLHKTIFSPATVVAIAVAIVESERWRRPRGRNPRF